MHDLSSAAVLEARPNDAHHFGVAQLRKLHRAPSQKKVTGQETHLAHNKKKKKKKKERL
jgi:hypothetical protein